MWILKPLLWPGSAERLVKPQAGRIEQRSNWTSLQMEARPDIEPPGCGYALEILTGSKSEPLGLSSNHGHAWIRLWQEDGRYASLGFYPDESTGIDPERVPGLRYPGMLLSPDKYDRVGWPGQSTVIPLSRERFEALVAWIEHLQAGRQKGALVFDMVDRNCAGFVVEAAAQAGVKARADQPILAFLPAWMHLPPGLTGWIRPVRRLFYRLGLAVFGGFSTVNWYWSRGEGGDLIRCQVSGQKPLFETVRDLFSKKVPFNHVLALQQWQKRQAGTHPIHLRTERPAPEHRLSTADGKAMGEAG
ncbi:hypothetical protein SAMN05444272_2110 [Roseibium suaedae]|uniref:DUF4105 domain-containing protein n=1 Tax=Roseibium suaedae TaxID=735517 RepID=A0A1M7H5E4_9HYPH|nr:hypothetical protein SAMN05444272_2110 [Roseibium suaedae]